MEPYAEDAWRSLRIGSCTFAVAGAPSLHTSPASFQDYLTILWTPEVCMRAWCVFGLGMSCAMAGSVCACTCAVDAHVWHSVARSSAGPHVMNDRRPLHALRSGVRGPRRGHPERPGATADACSLQAHARSHPLWRAAAAQQRSCCWRQCCSACGRARACRGGLSGASTAACMKAADSLLHHRSDAPLASNAEALTSCMQHGGGSRVYCVT